MESKTEKDVQLLREFGSRVRSARLKKNLSQEALADLAGLDRTYIGGIERGERNVSLLNIAKIATSLGTSIALLLEGRRE